MTSGIRRCHFSFVFLSPSTFYFLKERKQNTVKLETKTRETRELGEVLGKTGGGGASVKKRWDAACVHALRGEGKEERELARRLRGRMRLKLNYFNLVNSNLLEDVFFC